MATLLLLTRVAGLLYLTALTILLLVPDPMAWLFGVVPDVSPPHRGVHFCAFALLALLVMGARLPWKPVTIAILLFGYAMATESLQGLVENRVVELADYTENILGLIVGGAVASVVSRRGGRQSG